LNTMPTVTPIGGGIGADVSGIDLSRELDAGQIDAIRTAWHRHLVLRFRRQTLTDQQLMAFSARLGTLARADVTALMRKNFDFWKRAVELARFQPLDS